MNPTTKFELPTRNKSHWFLLLFFLVLLYLTGALVIPSVKNKKFTADWKFSWITGGSREDSVDCEYSDDLIHMSTLPNGKKFIPVKTPSSGDGKTCQDILDTWKTDNPESKVSWSPTIKYTEIPKPGAYQDKNCTDTTICPSTSA
jgi:hypothetical protein